MHDTYDFNDRQQTPEYRKEQIDYYDQSIGRPSTGKSEVRKRRFEEQRRIIDAQEVEDDLNETKKALDKIQRQQRVLEMSRDRSSSANKDKIGGHKFKQTMQKPNTKPMGGSTSGGLGAREQSTDR